MFSIKTEARFDSAHFLADYEGKCRNIHGHQWRVEVEVFRKDVDTSGQTRGMLFDFGKLKADLRSETKKLDHSLIIEEGSLKETTLAALLDEGFTVHQFPFRPTAEMFAKYFCEKMSTYGYQVKRCSVYETPFNCASYSPDDPCAQGGGK